MNETIIKGKIKKILESNGWVVIRLRSAEGAGWPDMICLKNGRCVFVETKTPNGTVSRMQIVKHKILLKIGFSVVIISDYKNTLTLFNHVENNTASYWKS